MADKPEDIDLGGDDSLEGEIDPGEPIPELATLGVSPGRDFMGRLRRKIGRRELTADVVGFSTGSPVTVFMEFLALIFDGLAGRKARPGGDR